MCEPVENKLDDYDDLVSELEFKLTDLLSHLKLLANSTCIGVDFELDKNDVNRVSLTLHDKTLSAIFVIQKLRITLERLFQNN